MRELLRFEQESSYVLQYRVRMLKNIPALTTLVILSAVLCAAVAITKVEPYDHRLDERTETASYASLATSSTSPGALRIPIMIYHSVRPDFLGESKRQKEFSITPEILEAQLKYLQANGYTAISLDELANDIHNGTTSPVAKPVVLTLDDGWRNQYEYAFPLLEKYHDTATFFIYTKPISSYPDFMTWDQIRALDAAGMTIGDHTVTHPYLSKLTSQQLTAEVFGAKKILEQHLGKPIVHFASPFGYTSDNLVALLKSAGFVTGRTTYKGAYHTRNDELRLTGFLVKRDMRDFMWTLKYSP